MDDLSSHVCAKIKSAIKAKLKELGSYVDNELPDYIMVLVVNKKTKVQMDNDLSLFLGHNTEQFTSWLTDVLEKLNTATSAVPPPAASAPATIPASKPTASATLSSEATTSATAGVPKKEAEAVKNKKTKEEERVPVLPSTNEGDKLNENADLKKSKDQKKPKKDKKDKQEKKEKKQKKKEEKRLKKESKKKILLEAERAVSENVIECSNADNSNVDGKNLLPVIKKVVENHPTQNIEDNSTVKRKVYDDNGLEKIMLTIHNDHHKPVTESNVGDEITNSTTPNGNIKSKSKEKDEAKKLARLEKKAKKLREKAARFTDEQKSVNEEEKEEVVADLEEPEKPAEESQTEDAEVGEFEKTSDTPGDSDEETAEESNENATQNETLEVYHDEDEYSDENESEAGVHADGRKVKSRVKRKSVLDRLGPPRSSKRARSCSPNASVKLRLTDGRTGGQMGLLAHAVSGDECEEPSQLRVASKVTASVVPNKRLEARVRPMSVVCRSPTEEGDRLQSTVDVMSREGKRSSARGLVGSSLILRAVADANRSVNTGIKRSAEVEPEEQESSRKSKKPKVEVFTRAFRDKEERYRRSTKDKRPLQKLSITVSNNTASRDGSSQRKRRREPDIDMESQDMEEEEVEEFIEEVEEWVEVVEGGRASVDMMQAPGNLLNDAVNLPLDDLVSANSGIRGEKNPSMCMYWPSCRSGDACLYTHPNVMCKSFPNCSFGNKCAYKHPLCKFDGLCSRANCAFSHSTKHRAIVSTPSVAFPAKNKLSKVNIPLRSKLNATAVPFKPLPDTIFTLTPLAPKPPVVNKVAVECHYRSRCNNPACLFSHPFGQAVERQTTFKKIQKDSRPCKFGAACMSPGCAFSHPEYSSGAKLKWVAKARPSNTSLVNTAVVEAAAKLALSKETAVKAGTKQEISAAGVDAVAAKAAKPVNKHPLITTATHARAKPSGRELLTQTEVV